MNLRFVPGAALAVLGGLGTSAFASDSCVDVAPLVEAERDPQTHLRQARLFEKKGWLDDAIRELAMARNTPDGRQDPEVYALQADLMLKQENIVGARCLAKVAVDMNRSGTATEQARSLLRELDRSYGYLTIYTSGDATTASFSVQPPKLFATADLKAYAERRVAELAKRHPLPVHVALPAGAYTINGQSITVLPGQAQDLTLHPKRTRPAWASPVIRLRAGAEVRPAQSHFPPPLVAATDFSTTWPVVRGRQASLQLGARVGGVMGRSTDGGTEVPAGGDVGAVLSGVWVSDVNIDLHTDLAFSRASVAGVGFSCPVDGSSCGATSTGAAADTVYLRASGFQWRLTPGLDLRGAGTFEALGVGLECGVVRSGGTLSSKQATIDGSTWALSPAAWSTWSIVPSLSVSIRL